MSITERIQQLNGAISSFEHLYHRPEHSVQLLAVSKGHSVAAIEEAFKAGIHEFGENYWQEAQSKMRALAFLPIHWHFIGPVQSNKAAEIAAHCSWVHSINREKIARLLSQHRPAALPPLNLCIQVNIDEEDSKSGVHPVQIPALTHLIIQLPRVKLRGLMTVPRRGANEEAQYQSFCRLHQLLQEINQEFNLNLDTLSMGMSDDLAAAIKAGSTLVRVGRAIFGER